MSFIEGLANSFRDAASTPQDKENRANLHTIAITAKIVAVAFGVFAATAAALTFLSNSPLLIAVTIITTGISLVAAHDVFQIANNLQKITDKATTHFMATLSDERLTKHLGQRTLFASHFLNFSLENSRR